MHSTPRPVSRLPAPVLGLLLSTTLAAQTAPPAEQPPAEAARRLSVVTVAEAGTELYVGRNHGAGAVRTPGGVLLVAVASTTRGDGNAMEQGVQLFRSDDQGRTWQSTVRVDRPGAHDPVLAQSPSSEIVHLGFSAPTDANPGFDGAWLRSYDPTTGDWTSPATNLAAGRNGNDEFLFTNLVVTPDGQDLVAAIQPHRSPQAGWTSWSSALLVTPVATRTFTKPQRINLGSSGIAPSLAARDGLLHATYRTFGPNYGIHLRSFDLATRGFVQEKDTPLSPGKGQVLEATNCSSSAFDANGNLYTLFERGGRQAGDGLLELTFVPAAPESEAHLDATALTRLRVALDPPRVGGNHNPQDFVLVPGPGDLVHAVYALVSEQRQRLYLRTFALGQAIGEARLLAEGAPQAFSRITPLAGSQPPGQLLVAVSGTADDGKGRRVALVAQSWPRTRR